MAGPCDLKTFNQAYNDAVNSFRDAWMMTGGDMDKSLRFAVSEARKNNPDIKFDTESLTDPIINQLKKKGLVDGDYQFGEKSKKVKSSEVREKKREIEKEVKDREKEKMAVTRTIDKAIAKLEKLTDNQKKDMAREMVSAFLEDGILDDKRVKNIYAKVMGMPHMNPEMESLIDKVVDNRKALDDAESEIRQMQKHIADNPKDYADNETKQKAISSALASAKNINTLRHQSIQNSKQLADLLNKKGYWISDFADQVQLGLMGVKSLIKNATGVLPDGIIRQMSGGTSAVVNAMMRPFTGVNSNPFGARMLGGANKMGEAGQNVMLALKYKHRFGQTKPPQADFMNAANQWKKAMDDYGARKVLLAAAAGMKVNADVVSRILTATDAIPKSLAYHGELNRIASEKGLTGAAKQLFLTQPDAESHDKAFDYALDVAFESDVKIPITGKKISVSYDHRAAAEEMIKKGKNPMLAHTQTSVVKIGMNLTIPFIKVPLNLLRKASELVVPEYTMLKGLSKAAYFEKDKPWAERQGMIADAIGKATVGFYVRSVAMQMAAAGAITGAFDDEEQQTKDNTEKVAGGSNRINLDALMRTMFLGKKAENKTGDYFIPNTFLGAFGIAMGGYAHAFNMLSRKDMEKYNNSIASSLRPDIGVRSAWGAAVSALDNPFFTGTNNFIKVLTDKEGNQINKMGINVVSMLGGGILPATYQKLSMDNTPEMVRRYDKEKGFSDNLATELGYKFSFQNKDLKKNYFSMASKDGAVKEKKHVLFDNYFGRALYDNFSIEAHRVAEGTPDMKLYNAMKDVGLKERGELFPNAPKSTMSVSVNGKKRTAKLTEGQDEYLQEKASVTRLLLATPYIMSPDFESSNHATRVAKLHELYEKGLGIAKEMTKKKFPDIKKQGEPKTGSEEVNKKVMAKHYK